MKVKTFAAVFAACCLLLSGCGAQGGGSAASRPGSTSNSYSAGSKEDYDSENMVTGDALESTGTGSEDHTGQSGIPSSQKMIQYLEYDIETMEFDQAADALEQLCSRLGGYVQESNLNGGSLSTRARLKEASYVLRVPSDKLGEFKRGAEGIGTVVRTSTTSENVTEQYYDTEARLKSLRVQEERLLVLMEKSETLTDVIELENALAEVTYEIESLTSSLRRYDSLIDYSTITVTLGEVVAYSETPDVPRTLGQRISQRFSASLNGIAQFGQGLLVLVLGSAPVILLLAAIFCGIFFPVRYHKQKMMREQKNREASSSVPEKPQE